MNRKIVFSMLGKILLVEAGLMLLPILFGLVYGESSAIWFAVSSAIAANLAKG